MSDGDAGGGGGGGGGSATTSSDPAGNSNSNSGGNSGGGNDSGAAAAGSSNNDDFSGEMSAPYGVNVSQANHGQEHNADMDRPPDLAYNKGRIGSSSPRKPGKHSFYLNRRQRTLDLDEYFVSITTSFYHLTFVTSHKR